MKKKNTSHSTIQLFRSGLAIEKRLHWQNIEDGAAMHVITKMEVHLGCYSTPENIRIVFLNLIGCCIFGSSNKGNKRVSAPL